MQAKDFFISYTGADVAWAEWIADVLEQVGHRTILQAWDFRPGDNFIQRMDQALSEAERVLAVLTPAYLASEYARDEWTAALVRDRGQPDRLLPVRVEPCRVPPLLATRVYLDLVGLEEADAMARLRAGVQHGRGKPHGQRPYPGVVAHTSEPAGVSYPGRRPAILHLPPRNPHFTGRDDLLARLRHDLAETKEGAVVQASAVYGLGGVGKTELAIEYAHRYAGDYDVIWRLPAEQPIAVAGKLLALARRLGISEQADQAETIALLWSELGQRDRWLLIYDNAEAPASLAGLRPPAGAGHVLITSRNPAWGGIAAAIPVDVLPRDEAIEFLQRRLGTNTCDPVLLVQLADALGGLPLALEQAAAYLEETGAPVGEYLALLRERAPELFALGQPASSEQTIATTWMVPLDRVRTEAPAALDLLQLCAFLSPDNLYRDFFTDHPDALPEQLAAAVRDRLSFQQTLGALRRYSLVRVTGTAIGMHRLLQAVVRHSLDRHGQQHWAKTAVRLILAAFPSAPGDNVEAWPKAAQLLPHALVAADRAEALDADLTATATLLTAAGRYLSVRAEYTTARMLHQRALAIREACLGPDHLDTAESLDGLAGAILHAESDLDRARVLYERALAVFQAALDPDHPRIAQSRSTIANVMRAQGDLDAARILHERAQSIFDAVYGPDEFPTAWNLINLAHVLHDQGDLDRARVLFERALATYETRMGPDHPRTAQGLSSLASVLRAQGDLDRARVLFERALAIYEARMGPDHPETIWSRQNLAAVTAELEHRQ